MSVSVNKISLCLFLINLFALGYSYTALPLEVMVRPIFWTKDLIERIPYDTVFQDEIDPRKYKGNELWDAYGRIKASKPNPPFWKQPGFYESQGTPPSWATETPNWQPQNYPAPQGGWPNIDPR